MERVAVMGAGSWGTTFAAVLADGGAQVRLWARRPEVAREVDERRTNAAYLPGVVLPQGVSASSDAARVLAGADLVVLAVPSQSLRATLGRWRDLLPADALLVSLMKGVEVGTHLRMSEVVADVTGRSPQRLAVVSGPNLAREIAARQPTATVVACRDPHAAERVAAACSTSYFRPYTQDDVVGVEVAGAVKNVIALAVGIAEGLGYGDNSKASIITRGLAETSRLATALGAQASTLAGLAGMGDLVATCASPLSRNRRVGLELGRGARVGEILSRARQTAEGVTSCPAVLELARSAGVDVPICEAVAAVVAEELPVSDLAGALLSRSRRAE